MSITKARLLARLRRDDGVLSSEYSVLVLVGLVFVGALLLIARSEAVHTHLNNLILKELS
ncbi:DUF4244 domain-containing protein [Dactylosporangium vinaceum]|uniref:DUF4244 domain-containing protein n=1 Tax=Dactylosporangium vinaceum TaxID=53362 RepID=A0ABV5MLV4_9ACTN|nr:DUF4244 domain-containing protein [Dactylosporangium vinaceum]UAB96852.1 DUF4244 domain-containing protein [Dactylosporangium vinaceum]